MYRRFIPCVLACLAALGFLIAGAASPARAAGITDIAVFTGANGSGPESPVTIDSQGNLFGTTYNGGTANVGVVWEIPYGTNTLTVIASFTGTGQAGDTNGENPAAGVTIDGSGNLYGTTLGGGASGYAGTVWEIVHGTNAITTLASFTGANGDYPVGGVTLDAAGNLYGTTENGGPNSNGGTVWEIPRSTGILKTLVVFTGANGSFPKASLTLDSSGNLYGTTEQGGSGGNGTVFELPQGSANLITLASFTGTNGSFPDSPLTLDSSGNLYGTTVRGGDSNNDGVVYKLAHGANAITDVAVFSGVGNGYGTISSVTIDGAGNLFGTLPYKSSQAVWEVAAGTNTVTTLATFNPNNAEGSQPLAGLTLDAEGRLLGTATAGAGGHGVVFQISGAAAPLTPSHAQLLWNNVNGQAALWNVNPDFSYTANVYGPFSGYTARAVAEAPNGSTYLLWTSTNGTASLWNVTGSGYTHTEYGPYANYAAVSLSVGGDGRPHLLWDKTDGTALLWTINPITGAFTYTTYGPFAGYTAHQVASGATVTDLLWTKTDGTAAGWRINDADGTYVTHTFGPFANYSAVGLSVGQDDGAHLLWDSTGGTESLWNADFTTGAYTYTPYGPFSGYAAKAIATGPDGGTRMLWDNTNGQASLWDVTGSSYTHHEYGPFSGWTAVAVGAGP